MCQVAWESQTKKVGDNIKETGQEHIVIMYLIAAKEIDDKYMDIKPNNLSFVYKDIMQEFKDLTQ